LLTEFEKNVFKFIAVVFNQLTVRI
jgi:hypothetical protein